MVASAPEEGEGEGSTGRRDAIPEHQGKAGLGLARGLGWHGDR
jgi:hypothetical protein